MADTQVLKVPALPGVLSLNRKYMSFVFERFRDKYLPAYAANLVSEDADGLGYKFVLVDVDGNLVAATRAAGVFANFIQPYWKGASSFDQAAGNYMISVSLARTVTLYSEVIIIAGAGFLAWEMVRNFGRE